MKCEQHGVEMEWRGSLAAGRMYCEQCASTGGRSYADIAKDLLKPELYMDLCAPGTTDKTIGQIRRYSPAALQDAEQRVKAAESMIDQHNLGHVAFCPYCRTDTGPDHTSIVNARGCREQYWDDLDYIRNNKP